MRLKNGRIGPVADIITFFQDVVYVHLHPDLYLKYIIMFDLFFFMIGLFLWHFVYMHFRKQLHIRDLHGRDEVIGLIFSKKKALITPHKQSCEFLIKFRRRGFNFFRDLIHPLRLYYLPVEEVPPFHVRWRHIYITGGHQEFREHPQSIHENYYYLAPESRNKGVYEQAGDYMAQGQMYLRGVTRTCHIAIQADAELATERFMLDSVAIDLPGLDALEHKKASSPLLEG